MQLHVQMRLISRAARPQPRTREHGALQRPGDVQHSADCAGDRDGYGPHAEGCAQGVNFHAFAGHVGLQPAEGNTESGGTAHACSPLTAIGILEHSHYTVGCDNMYAVQTKIGYGTCTAGACGWENKTCTAALSWPHLYVPISGFRSMSPVMVMGTAPKRPAAPCRYMRPRSSSRSMSAPEMSSGASQKWTSAPVERT